MGDDYFGRSNCIVRRGTTGATCTIFYYDVETFGWRLQAEERISISSFKMKLAKPQRGSAVAVPAAAAAALSHGGAVKGTSEVAAPWPQA